MFALVNNEHRPTGRFRLNSSKGMMATLWEEGRAGLGPQCGDGEDGDPGA